MKRIFSAAIAVAATALAASIPARATTFPSLTTIYVASGVADNSTADNVGIHTVASCSNLSGQTASVRYIFRRSEGTIAATGTLLLANLAAQVVGTDGAVLFYYNDVDLPTGIMTGGTLQILSTQSAVYCSAMLIEASGASGPIGVDLHMVRFNPHPGTVE